MEESYLQLHAGVSLEVLNKTTQISNRRTNVQVESSLMQKGVLFNTLRRGCGGACSTHSGG